jgi:hypothetical protein
LALPPSLGMPRPLTATLLFGALATASCASSVERTAADKVKVFQERADAGRLAEIRQEYNPDVIGWEKWMQRRHQELGNLKRTSNAQVDDNALKYGVLWMWYNSEFEHGQALEEFQFKVVDGVPRLDGYAYHMGTKRECSITGCKDVDVTGKSASLSR